MPFRTWRSTSIVFALACYWLALFALTHMPAQMVPPPERLSDKIPHVIGFAVLGVLLASVWHVMAGPLSWRQLGIIWTLILLYGAVDELTQIPVGRDASFSDWRADALGAALGLAAFQVWRFTVARRSGS